MSEPDYSTPRFAGGCIGVDLKRRGGNDDHIMIELCVEDDESWHRKLSVSSAWLDDMIEVLLRAKAHCEKREVQDQFGWKFLKS